MFNDVITSDKNTLAVFVKFLAGFYVSNKVNFQTITSTYVLN